MRQFIADEFDISEHEVTAMSVEGASIDNETTATLTSKIVISDEVTDYHERDIKNKKSKKVYSADQIKEILDGDARSLAIAYMKLGHPIAETRGKTEQELRQMIFAEVRPEDEVVLSILHGDIMQLRQFLSNMGVQKGKLLGNRSKLEQMARSIIGEDVVSFVIQNMAKKYHQPDDES